jgi:hypothetical protein
VSSDDAGAARAESSTLFWVLVTLGGLVLLAVLFLAAAFLFVAPARARAAHASAVGAPAAAPTAPAAAPSAPAEPARTR